MYFDVVCAFQSFLKGTSFIWVNTVGLNGAKIVKKGQTAQNVNYSQRILISYFYFFKFL